MISVQGHTLSPKPHIRARRGCCTTDSLQNTLSKDPSETSEPTHGKGDILIFPAPLDYTPRRRSLRRSCRTGARCQRGQPLCGLHLPIHGRRSARGHVIRIPIGLVKLMLWRERHALGGRHLGIVGILRRAWRGWAICVVRGGDGTAVRVRMHVVRWRGD